MNPRPLGYEPSRHCSTLDSTTRARPACSGSIRSLGFAHWADLAGSLIFRLVGLQPRHERPPCDDLLTGQSNVRGASRGLREDVARLAPLGHAHLNCLGRYAFATQPAKACGRGVT
jgi:hypothetical protein